MNISIVPTDHLINEASHLTNWLANGYHGQMSFLARKPERRCDPSQVLPECKSVIVCAMRYEEMPKKVERLSVTRLETSNVICNMAGERSTYDDSSRATATDQRQTVKYLLHKDYHKIMMQKLEAIADVIKQEHPSAQCKCYVDTGPVLEKAWAVRAGLGFIGKNTLLISPEHGSQMALGIILTNVKPRDISFEQLAVSGQQLVANCSLLPANRSHCGSCRKCLDTCPTGALVAPYTLNARKCISYKFFIAKKDGGCDICQNICPYNRQEVNEHLA